MFISAPVTVMCRLGTWSLHQAILVQLIVAIMNGEIVATTATQFITRFIHVMLIVMMFVIRTEDVDNE